MSALSITADNVAIVAGASITNGVLGAAATAGQTLYKHSDGTWRLAQADGTALEADCKGIALGAGAIGQTISIFTGGDIDLGATLAIGETYVLGATPGSIYPVGDLVTDDYVHILGVATAADNLHSLFYSSGTQHYSTA